MISNTANILGIEMLAAAQGIEFLRPLKSSVVKSQSDGMNFTGPRPPRCSHPPLPPAQHTGVAAAPSSARSRALSRINPD